MDILLPMNLYLLLQIALRKKISVSKSRMTAGIFTILFGISVEVSQLIDIDLFGSTYDPLDIFMYGLGISLGIVIDFTIINNFERK